MLNVSLGENGSVSSSLNKLYGCVNSVIHDRPVLGGDAGVEGDALEWSGEVMNYSELAGNFLFPHSQGKVQSSSLPIVPIPTWPPRLVDCPMQFCCSLLLPFYCSSYLMLSGRWAY